MLIRFSSAAAYEQAESDEYGPWTIFGTGSYP